MRELKFRAWVFYGQKLEKPNYSRDYGSLSRFFEDHDEDDTDQCIELYTGLKDKNLKEIYEGDILMTPDGKLIEIGWNNKYARFGYHGITAGYNAFTSLGKCKVIGNIHENPELLEEE